MLLPIPAVADHVVDTVLGFPTQLCFRFGGVAVAGGDVAGTARLDAVGHVHAVDADEGLHHVEHTVSVAGTHIIDECVIA